MRPDPPGEVAQQVGRVPVEDLGEQLGPADRCPEQLGVGARRARSSAARRGRSHPYLSDAPASGSREGSRERFTAASAGARSPRGSTTTSASPSHPASRRSSAESSSAVSAGRRGSAYAPLTSSRPRLAVRLEVDPGDDPVAEQERQHVVAVDPLLGGDVDLDAVVEVEERLGARPLPHHRVERAQQRPGADPARQPGVAVQVGRSLPARDRRPGPARPPRPGRRRRSRCPPPASGSSRAGPGRSRPRGSGRPDGPARARPPRRVGVGRARTRGRDHPLGQVVADLELAVAAGDGHLPRRVEVVEHPAGLGPVPAPVVLRARQPVVEVPGGRGAAVGELGEQALLRASSLAATKPHLPRLAR